MVYLYRHIRLDKNEPFYIGIGSDKQYKRSNKIKLSKLGKPSLKKIALFQLDKNLSIINEFQSITDAINKTKIKGVGNALTGLAKTAGGYIWKYK
jgi:hypothetical protein